MGIDSPCHVYPDPIPCPFVNLIDLPISAGNKFISFSKPLKSDKRNTYVFGPFSIFRLNSILGAFFCPALLGSSSVTAARESLNGSIFLFK